MPLTCSRGVCALFAASWSAVAFVPIQSAAAQQPEATIIKSDRDAARLRTAQGITLQWIGWEQRGDIHIERGSDGVWRINGLQREGSGGRLAVDGDIVEIGKDYFILDGRIAMTGTPSRSRMCVMDRKWRFEVTQNRTYYRLREFEWCDSLTDYIDIYFAPSLR